ncbi:uncharacterized protein [Lolium perenne]|uniref:uncharacterized protein n=1 Tax=Lolium perenne TaxID=4522 RepID=UPI0021F6594D|nr:uncharacterized protein LOC127307985 [Lolium perenne]
MPTPGRRLPLPPRSVRLDHVIPADAAELGLGTGGLLSAAIENLERKPAARPTTRPRSPTSPRGSSSSCSSTSRSRAVTPLLRAPRGLRLAASRRLHRWRDHGAHDRAIACGWIERLVGAGGDVFDVSALLGEVDCVGLHPGFSRVVKATVLYWDRSERAHAVEFVRDVLRRGSVSAGADYDGKTSDGQGGVQIPPSPRNPIPLSPKHAKFMTSLAQILSLGFVARNRLPAPSVPQRRALPRIPRHGLPQDLFYIDWEEILRLICQLQTTFHLWEQVASITGEDVQGG